MLRFIILSILLLASTFSGTQAQDVVANSESNKWISFQIGSRMAESVPNESDVMKAKFAERLMLEQKFSQSKAKTDHLSMEKVFKQYLPSNTGTNGISGTFARFLYQTADGDAYISTNGVDIWDGFSWDNLNPENSNLPAVTVFDMVEDERGNLWFATFNGLARWDKLSQTINVYRPENSGIRSPLVYTLYKDASGLIYAGHRYDPTHEGGVTVFNDNGNVVRTISSADNGMYGSSVEDFAQHGTKLFIATGPDPNTGDYGGISVWNLSTNEIDTNYTDANSGLAHNEVSSLTVDSDGNLWAGLYTNPNVGNSEGGLVMYDGTNWTHYSSDQGDDIGTRIMDLMVSKDGTLWIGANDGAYTYDGVTLAQVSGGEDNGYALSNVSTISELQDGRIAFTKFHTMLEGGGLSIWNPENDTWEHFSTRDGGVNAEVNFGADYDSKGNLWVTGFYGLQKYDGSSWQTWTEKDGLAYTYGWDLIVDQNDNVWVNGAGHVGLTKINADGTIETLEVGSFVESNWEASDGSLWFGDWYGDYDDDGTFESNGILHIDGTNQTVYDSTDGLPGGTAGAIVSIAEDQSGRILAATHDGLYRLESGSFTKWEFPGYVSGAVFKVHLDSQNRLWIHGGAEEPISMYDGSNWHYYGHQDGIGYGITDIEEDMSGRVWFTQGNFAAYFENGSFHKVSGKDGMPLTGSGHGFTALYDIAPSRTEAGTISFGSYRGGIITMNAEIPIAIASLEDNPNDQGGWVRMSVDGYLLSNQYTGTQASVWSPQIKMDGNWEAAAPTSSAASKSVSIQVPVTKPADEDPSDSTSFEFRVVALSEDGDVLGVSETMVGYAVDNIAPSQVQDVVAQRTGESDITLSWEAVPDNDVDGYAVFEASVTDFSGTDPIAFSTTSQAVIADEGYEELVVVAVDENNNYGSPSESAMVTTNENVMADTPNEFMLEQNYPNPFNPATIISYALPQSSHTKITVFNSLGQRVATLINKVQPAGNHEVSFNAEQLNSGMYIYRIEAGSFTQTRKMMLIK